MADELDAPVQEQPPKQLSVDEFAAQIKAKYPDYAKIDNAELAKKVIEKYPIYAARVNLGSHNPNIPSQIPLSQPQGNLSPVLPQYRDDMRQQQQAKVQAQSDHFKQLRSELPKESQQNWDSAIQASNAVNPDQLSAPTKEEQDHYNFMQTPMGKTLGAVGYLGSQATHGTLQVAKGLAHIANLGLNPTSAFTGEDPTKEAFDKADKLADFGLTEGDKKRIEEGSGMGMHALAAAGQMANFAPALAGGEIGETAHLPKVMLYLQGVGQGKELADKIPNLNPAAKEALIQGGGLVNMALADFGGRFFGKGVSSAVKDKVVTGIAADALKESAEKGFTEDGYKNLLTGKAQSFAEKFDRAPSEVLKHYTDAAKTLTKLNVGNYAVHKGVDALQEASGDKPVFNENLGTLAENENKTLTQQVPLFGSLGAIGAASKLLPNSGYENDITKSVIDNPTKENLDNIKYQVEQHGHEQGWNNDEINATHEHIDKIANAVNSLPPTIKDKTKAVGLVLGRNELQTELDKAQSEREKLDPAVAELPNAKEQYLTDKIEQANDKLRGLVTDKKSTYSKGIGDEEGKFFKTTDGVKEEITPSRYELENTEREAKKQINEQTEPNQEVSAEPQANEAASKEETLNPINETTENTPIKPQENETSNESNGEISSQESNEEGSPESESGNEKGVPNEKEVVNSGADQTVPETINTEQPIENGTDEQSTGTDNNGGATKTTEAEVQTKPVKAPKGEESKQRTPSLTEQESSRKLELRKKFSGRFNDVTNIPTLLADKEFREYAGLVFKEAAGDFKAFSKELIDNVGEKIKEHLPALYKELGGKISESDKEPTGIRNEDVAKERGKEVARDKMTKPEIEKEGKRLVDSGDVDPDELAQTIIKDKKPISAEQQAALLYRKIQLKNRQRAILKESENPENITENQIEYAKNADLIDANQQATEIAGNVTGRALGFRTETMNEDFSRNSVMRRAKMANNGEELDPKDQRELEIRIKRIEELENKLSDKEEQIRRLHENGLVNKVKRSAELEERQGKREVTKASLRKEREGLLADLHLIAKKSRGTLGANKIPVDMVAPLTKLARNYVLDGVVTLSGVVDKLYADLKDHIEDLSKEDIANLVKENFDKYLHEQNEIRLERGKKLLGAKLTKLKEQNESGSFEKNVRRKIDVDNDYLKIRADINREQTLINARIANIEQSNKSIAAKARDFAVKYGRQAKLASVKVLGKLAAAGLTTLGLKPITEGVGSIYAKLLPKIAAKATVEGKGNIKALTKSYAKAATEGMKDAYDELNIKAGGQSDLSALYGKYMISKLPAEAADFFGHVHSAIKAPIKRFAWEYSYAKRMETQIKQGIDVQDPVIDAKNRLDAYKDAERAIFMGDNVISKAYEAALSPMEKGSSIFGKNIAATARILLPFVKVPTNIALSTARHTFGLPMGLGKLSQIGLSSALRKAGAESMAKVIHKGLGELTPEESDMVLRNLKHGSVGGAALLLGFYNPKNVGGFYQENEHRKKGEAKADSFKIFDVPVPRFLTEHPIFQAMQVGATYRRVLDAHRHKEDNINAASLATVSGLVEGIPLASEAKQFTDLFGSDTKKFNKFISSMIKGEIEPSVLQELAQATDTKNGDLFTFKDKNQNRRAPRKNRGMGTYIKEDLETGVPGLRQNVPKKP